MSSTDRLLMAAQDITDDLKHPHTDVPFATIGEDTISALAILSDIFTKKFKKGSAPVVPTEANKNTRTRDQERPIPPPLISPIRGQHQTRTHTQVSHTVPDTVNASQDSPSPPRVVTPATGNAAPLRVPIRARRASPRNLSRVFLIWVAPILQLPWVKIIGHTHQ